MIQDISGARLLVCTREQKCILMHVKYIPITLLARFEIPEKDEDLPAAQLSAIQAYLKRSVTGCSKRVEW